MTTSDDEQRLYLWVRVIGAVVLLSTAAVAMLLLVLGPLLVDDYHVDGSAVIGVAGLMLASGLAMVEVSVRLRRNGWGIDTRQEHDDDDERE